MLIIPAEETKARLSYGELIHALREAFKSGADAPLRPHYDLSNNTASGSMLLLMPSWSFDTGFGGVKLVNVNPDNNARGLPAISASYLLFDVYTGQHLCLMDASNITSRRTAASSALAASYLARPESSTLLIAGAGKVGSELADAFSEVLPIKEILVWDRKNAQSSKLVECLNDNGLNAHVIDSLEQAVGWADVISCATLAEEPIIKGEWLLAGQHIDLIGSFTPTMREVDDRALQRAKIFVDTQAAVIESGELQIPLNSGAIDKRDIGPTLYELCSSGKEWRSPEAITVFKAVGHAIEDLAAATLVYKARLAEMN